MTARARELDYVELLQDADGAAAGARGTVVSEYPGSALVELATESVRGRDGLPERELLDDLVTVPYSALRVIERAHATAG
jgi:hypothetical protein